MHDALAWLGLIGMFLILGLLVFPSGLVEVARMGLGLAILRAVVARPAVVALCLAPFRYPKREVAYIGWGRLRRAVPIVLATYPVLVGAPGADRIFHATPDALERGLDAHGTPSRPFLTAATMSATHPRLSKETSRPSETPGTFAAVGAVVRTSIASVREAAAWNALR